MKKLIPISISAALTVAALLLMSQTSIETVSAHGVIDQQYELNNAGSQIDASEPAGQSFTPSQNTMVAADALHKEPHVSDDRLRSAGERLPGACRLSELLRVLATSARKYLLSVTSSARRMRCLKKQIQHPVQCPAGIHPRPPAFGMLRRP